MAKNKKKVRWSRTTDERINLRGKIIVSYTSPEGGDAYIDSVDELPAAALIAKSRGGRVFYVGDEVSKEQLKAAVENAAVEKLRDEIYALEAEQRELPTKIEKLRAKIEAVKLEADDKKRKKQKRNKN